jgi:hypothetical protein
VVLDQVEIPVREQQPDFDLRVSSQELSDDGQDMQAPKKNWSCQYQFATGYVKLPGGDALRLIDLIEDPPGRAAWVASLAI